MTNSEPVFKCSHASCRTPLGDATGTLTIDTTHSMPFKPTFLSTPPQQGVWSPHQLLMEAGSLAFWKPSLLHFPCPHCHCFSEPLLPYTVHGFAPKTFYLGSPYIHPHTEKLTFLRIMSKTSKTHSLAGPLRPAYLGLSTSVPSNLICRVFLRSPKTLQLENTQAFTKPLSDEIMFNSLSSTLSP